jgi:hypothetical protein
MKPQPPPHVPGNTDAGRFDNAVCRMFIVSKEDLLKHETIEKRARGQKKRAKKSG